MTRRVPIKNRTLSVERFPVDVAPYGRRAVAFLLDFALVMMIAIFCLDRFILPENFPGIQEAMFIKASHYVDAVQMAKVKGEAIPILELEPKEQEAAAFVMAFLFFLFWMYSATSEALLKGASLGKRVFRLQVVGMYTFEPLGLFETLLRGGVKSITLMAYFPLLAIDYLVPLFNRRRQSLHDMICRSLVIVEPYHPELEEEEAEEDIADDDY